MTDDVGARLSDVRKIAVLDPFAVGDFVFTLPALRALRQAYPDAELALVGRAWHRELLMNRPGPVDRVLLMPAIPGVGTPADQAREAEVDAFIEAMRAEHFDIAAQMFGGGRYSNPLIAAFDARLTIGTRSDDAPPLTAGCTMQYRIIVDWRCWK